MVISGPGQFMHIAMELDVCLEPDIRVDQLIGIAMGWTNVTYRPLLGQYAGINPKTQRLENLPTFTRSVDAAISTKPDQWVMSIFERPSGIHDVSYRPHASLGVTQIETTSPYLAIAISRASMLAHYQMLNKE